MPSGAYALVGPASLSGEETAANWRAALGREVSYAPDIELTDQLLEKHYEPRKAHDFKKTYRLLAKLALPTKPAQVAQTSFLLGRPPRSHADFARELAETWQQASSEP